MPDLFVNDVQNGAGDGREAGDMSGQLKRAGCEPRNYKYFRSGNNPKRQSFANGFRHVRLLDGAKRVASPGVRALVRYAVFAGRAGQIAEHLVLVGIAHPVETLRREDTLRRPSGLRRRNARRGKQQYRKQCGGDITNHINLLIFVSVAAMATLELFALENAA